MEEIFKTIKNFTNYEVSNLGNIRDIHTKEKIITKIAPNGYEYVRLRSDYGKHNKIQNYVHILVAKTFLKKPDDYNTEKYVVNHKDSNRLNNCVDNLEWITQSENIKHGYRYGNMYKVTEAVKTANTKCYAFYNEDNQLVKVFYSQDKAAEFLGVTVNTIINHRKNNTLVKSKRTQNKYHVQKIELDNAYELVKDLYMNCNR